MSPALSSMLAVEHLDRAIFLPFYSILTVLGDALQAQAKDVSHEHELKLFKF